MTAQLTRKYLMNSLTMSRLTLIFPVLLLTSRICPPISENNSYDVISANDEKKLEAVLATVFLLKLVNFICGYQTFLILNKNK